MKQSFCVILSFFLLLVASKNANSAEVIEHVDFNFESFTNDNPLIQLQGDATFVTDSTVLLTDPASEAGSAGRILYEPTVRLWDTVSGNEASFITSFSFQTTDIPDYIPAEGLVFFIAPENTQIPLYNGRVVGGGLGVADIIGGGEFVGVEFDNHINTKYDDPPYSHIGIDEWSVYSTNYVEWNRVSGAVVNVTVIYDSSSNTLNVAVRNGNGEIVTISEVVDLKWTPHPRVKFGISAASSPSGRQLHVIRSWSFSSSLKIETTSDLGTA